MSGTSLDGLDIALCEFESPIKGIWPYKIIKAHTVPYTSEWKSQLKEAEDCSGHRLLLLHKEYGKFLGEQVSNFLGEDPHSVDLIASHGHTIFHQPEKQLTFQLGDGAFIAAHSGINTISDFRNLDVALGGQGAPLVPIGDSLLFQEYDQCLNLGGFANISFQLNEQRVAFDICPVNILLNHIVQEHFQKDYDFNGILGKQGSINQPLLDKLNSLGFYKANPPKSLGKEWVWSVILPMLSLSKLDKYDMLRTVYQHIAIQLTNTINQFDGEKVLVTGGGAFNLFLIELIQELTPKKIVIPDPLVVEFKEALIFAFLGLLRLMLTPNCLKTVTGARNDNFGGIMHLVNFK